MLQIENEFYGSIRPKRVVQTGERPSRALIERGIEYVEVRCIDLNPYVPIGIDQETIAFLDMFLLYCLFEESPTMTDKNMKIYQNNNQLAIMQGRDPNLILQRYNKQSTLKDWGEEMIGRMQPIAQMLDSVHFSKQHTQVLETQSKKLADSSQTPSAQILEDIEHKHHSYFAFAQHHSEKHEEFFKHLVQNCASKTTFEQQAAASISKQQEIEQADTQSFDDYLAAYFKQ